MTGFYVTISGLPVTFYTDQWFIGTSESWTIADLLGNICDMTAIAAESHELRKTGTPLSGTALVSDELSGGDTITLAEI